MKEHPEAEEFYKTGLKCKEMYHYGDTKGNIERLRDAIVCLRDAAGKGHAGAMEELGDIYHLEEFSELCRITYHGEDVDPEAEASKWYNDTVKEYKRRSQMGDADAWYHLYDIYRAGLLNRFGSYVIPKDEGEAAQCLRNAAELGHLKAQKELGEAFRTGNIPYVKKSKDGAFHWYGQAAQQGDAEAQCYLGDCYFSGRGVVKTPSLGIDWYTKAAEQGGGWGQTAMYKLGCVYAQGNGVNKDLEKAMEWHTKYAKQSGAEVKYKLGIFYANEIKDMEKAKHWFSLAAESGDKNAQKALAQLNKGAKSIKDRSRRRGGGCYVATCVYGSYDCPEVWTLRRYRDGGLSKSWFGRRFIMVYYAVSPKIVELFGGRKWFNRLCKAVLDKFVYALRNSGVESGRYSDRT